MSKIQSWMIFCEMIPETYGRLYKYINGKDLKNSDLIFMTMENSTVFEPYDDATTRLINSHFVIARPPADIYKFLALSNVAGNSD